MSRRDIWFGVVLLSAAAGRLYQFNHLPDDADQWRETQTLMLARSYEHGAALLTPGGNWSGLLERPAVLEFPIYSIFTHLLTPLVGLLSAGRIVSLAAGLASIVVFDRLCALRGHPRHRVATTLFALAPLAIYLSHSTQPDGLLLLLILVVAYSATRSQSTDRNALPWLVAAAVCLGVASAIKPTALFVLGPAILYDGLRHRRKGGRIFVLLVGVGATAAWAVFVRFVLKQQAPDWYLASTGFDWVYGPVSTRLQAALYASLLTSIGLVLLPPLAVGLIVAPAAGRSRDGYWWWWLAGFAVEFLVFANLNSFQAYYQVVAIPALAALAAYASPHLPKRLWMQAIAVAGLLFVTLLGTRTFYEEDRRYYDAGRALAAFTVGQSTMPVAVAVPGQSGPFVPYFPEVLFYADRLGWNVDATRSGQVIDLLPSPPVCVLVIAAPTSSSRTVPAGWTQVQEGDQYVIAQRQASGGCP